MSTVQNFDKRAHISLNPAPAPSCDEPPRLDAITVLRSKRRDIVQRHFTPMPPPSPREEKSCPQRIACPRHDPLLLDACDVASVRG